MHDLGAVLVRELVQGTLETGAPCLERSGGDVILEQLLVHDIDDGRDQRLDVFGAGDESLDVSYALSVSNLVKNTDPV